ncbi:Ubiquitin carboxyl-terminal hydrolase 37 [Nibea albiflora]|uniref:Ubiquitin carboxyl-terminal hydrolase 37 n=1 Tax=Nibea albiflora TaxID=240163 RepID=A0ACB7F9X2_NIBAL|nr:Ubiquitin carboxyl-terminal hydrolase 37 [Nibea albiflora]
MLAALLWLPPPQQTRTPGSQRMAFETLPNVLILHLKRFIYSPTYELVKLHDPVKLSRDLVASSNTGDGCYGLISVVGHFGSNGEAGHYICDSVHPDDSLSQTTDHWLTFDDSVVSNTTGASVCEQRRKSSYILFYKKQNSVADVSILNAHESHENKNTANEMVLFEPLDPCDKPSKVRFNSELHVNATTEAVRKEELNTGAISRLGFPNINQSCYMNSILQSLFAMVDLIKDFMCQKPVWGSVPEAKLIRSFMAIRDAHLSSGTWNKRRLLRSFRKAASTQGLSFSDQNQEDAHEFLISVLDQMRSLSSLLEVNAASMKRRYTCPVQRHLMFQIEKTRTCKRCGAQSKRKEDFTNLSLDLIPSGSVKEMVQAYVNVRSACPHSITSLTEHTPRQFVFVWTCFYNMWPVDSHLQETELEFKCECGGNTSGQRMAFETLPNVLILHLKRFIYSPTYELVKLHDPVKLSRDLVVSSNTGDGCYGLISVVGHFGSNGQAGHYICDSVHPDDSLSQTTDHWLTFDDSVVSNTTGASVCEQRRKSSYILFYKKQNGKRARQMFCATDDGLQDKSI